MAVEQVQIKLITTGARSTLDFRDEAAMDANDEFSVPSQKSVKDYVDASVAGVHTGSVSGDIITTGESPSTILSPGDGLAPASYFGNQSGGSVNPTRFMFASTNVVESGLLSGYSFYQLLDDTNPLACTIGVLDPGEVVIISQADSGTAGHTVTLEPGATFDGTNNTATFNALDETLVLLAISSIRFVILGNYGSVALSLV